MKQDAEVLVMLRERAKGRTQRQAAARAGMSVLWRESMITPAFAAA